MLRRMQFNGIQTDYTFPVCTLPKCGMLHALQIYILSTTEILIVINHIYLSLQSLFQEQE